MTLIWTAEAPVATAVVRLSDVPPDGPPAHVTSGVLNLTHRDSHELPEPLEPGRPAVVRIALRSAGYRFGEGHRIRLSVTSSAWPVVWPSPGSGTVALELDGRAELALPTVSPDDTIAVPAWKTSPPALEAVGESFDEPPVWRVTEDVIAGTVSVSTFEGGETVTADGSRLYASEAHELTARDADPALAEMRSDVRYRLDQDGHAIEAAADAALRSTVDAFELAVRLRVRLDGEAFFERDETESIPRWLV